jgi:predicted metal-dependent peptidase
MLVEMDPEEEAIAFPRDPKTGERMGMYDERFRGMDTKQVFDILREEQEEEDGGGGSGGQSDNGSGSPSQGNADGGLDSHDWDGAQELSESEKKQLTDDIDQALRQGGIYAGKVGGTMDRSIAELLAPKVDWRAVLRRFVKTHLKDRDAPSWRKAHRNYLWQDVILPAIIGKRMKHLVVAIDTSGSVQGPLLTAFISELNKIIEDINPERLDVLYWDTSVENHRRTHPVRRKWSAKPSREVVVGLTPTVLFCI